MQQRTISLALFISCALALVAQEDVKVNSLSLNWGMGELMRQDLTFSPFVHKDWSPINVQLAYERSQKMAKVKDDYTEWYTISAGERLEKNWPTDGFIRL